MQAVVRILHKMMTMVSKPRIEPKTTFINDPIVIATSRKGYFRWVEYLAISLPITYWFYLFYNQIPSQKELQIAVSLMIGLDVWIFFRIAELIRRKLTISFSGITYRSLLGEDTFDWTECKKVEWWYAFRERNNSYRIRLSNNRTLATFSDDTWSNLDNGIGYIVARNSIEPKEITPHIFGKLRIFVLLLMPLSIAIFSFADSHVWRIIGFLVARVFWSLLIWQQSQYDLRTTQFYMVLVSISAVFALMLVSGSDFQSTVIWWLYSPLIEVFVSWVIVELYKLWKKNQGQ